MVRFGDVAQIVTGSTPKAFDENFNGDIPFVTPGDLGEVADIHQAKRSLSALGAASVRTVPKRSVMVCCIGATIGKVGFATRDVATNQQINTLVFDEKIIFPKYAYYYCLTIKSLLVSKSSSTTMPIVNKSNFSDLKMPVPFLGLPSKSLAEQKRIAAILDKADAIRRKRQQAIQLADDFLRSVFLDMFGDPVTNPKGWEVKRLKDIAKIQIGPFGTQLHKEDYIENGIPLINPTHIVKGNIVPKSNLTITEEKHASLSEYHLKVGDIILGRRGEMGRCAIVSENEEGWMCGTGSLFIRPNQIGEFSEYLNKLLSSHAIKNHLESESQGATMSNLNKTIVGNIQIPVPSNAALDKFTLLKTNFLKLAGSSHDFANEMLFESLSQKAFAGEL